MNVPTLIFFILQTSFFNMLLIPHFSTYIHIIFYHNMLSVKITIKHFMNFYTKMYVFMNNEIPNFLLYLLG